jgi:hypothetical protein
MNLAILFVIFIIFLFCIIFKPKSRRVIFEGIIIGIISGVVISFATDANYRASIYGPFIMLGRAVDKNLRYASKNWGGIKATQVSDGVVNVSATNIVTGSVVNFTKTPLSKLPFDLRYAVATGDVATNKTIINISAPQIDSCHTVGGSVVKLNTEEPKAK